MAEEVAVTAAEAVDPLSSYLDDGTAALLEEVVAEGETAGDEVEAIAAEAVATDAPISEPSSASRTGEGPSDNAMQLANYLDTLSKGDPQAAAETLRNLAGMWDGAGAEAGDPKPSTTIQDWLGVEPEDLDQVNRAIADSVLNLHAYMERAGQKIDQLGAAMTAQRSEQSQEADAAREITRVQDKYQLADGDMERVVDVMEQRGMSDIEGAAAVLMLEDAKAGGGRRPPSPPRRTATRPAAPPPPAQPNIVPPSNSPYTNQTPATGLPGPDTYDMQEAFKEAARALQSGR